MSKRHKNFTFCVSPRVALANQTVLYSTNSHFRKREELSDVIKVQCSQTIYRIGCGCYMSCTRIFVISKYEYGFSAKYGISVCTCYDYISGSKSGRSRKGCFRTGGAGDGAYQQRQRTAIHFHPEYVNGCYVI